MEIGPYGGSSANGTQPRFEPSSIREVLSDWIAGRQRSRFGVALVAATLATGLIALPLYLRANRNNAPAAAAPEALLYRSAEGGPEQILSGATLEGKVFIRWTGDGATAVAFNLTEADPDGAILIESIDGQGPTFDFLTDDVGDPAPFDTSDYPNGSYDLLLSVATPDDEQRSAARFTVRNG